MPAVRGIEGRSHLHREHKLAWDAVAAKKARMHMDTGMDIDVQEEKAVAAKKAHTQVDTKMDIDVQEENAVAAKKTHTQVDTRMDIAMSEGSANDTPVDDIEMLEENEQDTPTCVWVPQALLSITITLNVGEEYRRSQNVPITGLPQTMEAVHVHASVVCAAQMDASHVILGRSEMPDRLANGGMST
jgi:hypothetical protein